MEVLLKDRLEVLVEEMMKRGIRLEDAREEFETRYIQTALGRTSGNQCKAAVAGRAVGTDDVGFLHRINMRQRQNRSSPVPLPPLPAIWCNAAGLSRRRSRISD